jgi:glycosyltransferase involved in cell wall biosynthesis
LGTVLKNEGVKWGAKGPKFSLITCTLERSWQLRRLAESLARQTEQRFEWIIVDQNEEPGVVRDALADILVTPTVYQERTPFLSGARNLGIDNARGDIIAFPDDDCWYPDNLLERVLRSFEMGGALFALTGQTVDATGKTSLGRYAKQDCLVRLRNAFLCGNSSTIFYRPAMGVRSPRFDTAFGPGLKRVTAGGAEDYDFICELTTIGKVHFMHDLRVFHEQVLPAARLQRGWGYARSMGAVWRKRRLDVPACLYWLMRPTAGSILSLMSGRPDEARYHWDVVRGRLWGWLYGVENESATS